MAGVNKQTEKLMELLSGVGLQNRKAFSELYGLTSAKLFGVILRIVKKREIAEEMLQEVFIKIWQRAGSYQSSRGNPLSWLLTIARNRALDCLRVQRGDQDVGYDDEMENIWMNLPDPESAAAQQAQSELLTECLGELSEGQMRSVKLAYLEGLTHTELAQRLGRPMGTIKSWIRRALQSLGKCVDRMTGCQNET